MEALAQEHFESAHQRVKYRSGTKGECGLMDLGEHRMDLGAKAHRSHESVY
ncbi:MAG: hypothetical protein J6386_16065 [Candidatus Synoicihabitans palmerolidicus]|nr:hypothetical protein [Candidatus Synoicihabitans palmerolidicus]MCC5024205.1 hypothetical protein [Candidatus Synoicihabitans palmerolidicus]